MNLVYTPKFCITIVFDFAWDDYNTQGNRRLCKILGVKQGALWGVFHLNFRQLPVANVTTFSKISKKEDDLARFTQIFGNVFLEVFFPFNLCPGISRIFAWMVRISQIQQFLKPLREISVPFVAVSKFSKVLVEWEAPVQPPWSWWMTSTGNTLSRSETSRRCFDSDRPVFAENKLGFNPCNKKTAQWPLFTGDNTTVVTTMFYSVHVMCPGDTAPN